MTSIKFIQRSAMRSILPVAQKDTSSSYTNDRRACARRLGGDRVHRGDGEAHATASWPKAHASDHAR